MSRLIKLAIGKGITKSELFAKEFITNKTAFNLSKDQMNKVGKLGNNPNERAFNMFHGKIDEKTEADFHHDVIRDVNRMDQASKDPNAEWNAAGTIASKDGHDYLVLSRLNMDPAVIAKILEDDTLMRELFSTFISGEKTLPSALFLKDEHVTDLNKMLYDERMLLPFLPQYMKDILKHNEEMWKNKSAMKGEGVFFNRTDVVKTRDQETLKFGKLTVKRVSAGTTPAHGLVGVLNWDIIYDENHPGRIVIMWHGAGQSYHAMIDGLNNIFASHVFPLMAEIWKRRMTSKVLDGDKAKTIDQIIKEDPALSAKVWFIKQMLAQKTFVLANETFAEPGKFNALLPPDFKTANTPDSEAAKRVLDDFIRAEAKGTLIEVSPEDWKNMTEKQFSDWAKEVEKKLDAADEATLTKILEPGLFIGKDRVNTGIENIIFSNNEAPWTADQGSKIAEKVGSIAKAVLTSVTVLELQQMIRDARKDATEPAKELASPSQNEVGADKAYDIGIIKRGLVDHGILENAESELADKQRSIKALSKSEVKKMSDMPEFSQWTNLSVDKALDQIIVPGVEKPALQGEEAYLAATLTTEAITVQKDITSPEDANTFKQSVDENLEAARKSKEAAESRALASGLQNSPEVVEAEASLREFEHKAEQGRELVNLHDHPDTVIGEAQNAEQHRADDYVDHVGDHFTPRHKD